MDARAERDLVCRLRRPRVCVSRRRRGRDRMGARRVRGGGRHHPDRARHPPAVEHGGSRLVTPVKLYGRPGSPQAHAIRDFLYRSDVPFEWIEHEKDTPVCVFSDGTRLENPTIRQIVAKLGWFRDPSRSEYDVAIYGAGPAGLSAAVYAASEGLKTIVVERWAVGGQAASSPKIENYLGVPKGISGAELADRAREQATRFGAEILLARENVRGDFTAGKRTGILSDGTKVVSRSAICATGVEYHKLLVEGEERFRGAGLYYGAGASEAELCVDDDVVIVGGGNSAAQAATQFARFARRVTMVVRGQSLKETISAYLVDGLSRPRTSTC